MLSDCQNRKRRRRRQLQDQSDVATDEKNSAHQQPNYMTQNPSNWLSLNSDRRNQNHLLLMRQSETETEMETNSLQFPQDDDTHVDLRVIISKRHRHRNIINSKTNTKLVGSIMKKYSRLSQHLLPLTKIIILICLVNCLLVSSQRVPITSSENPLRDLPAEPRGEQMMRQSSNTLELLTSLLSSYSNNNQPRGSLLNQRLPQPQLSTPVNPFNAQYQPQSNANRRLQIPQQLNKNNQVNLNNNNNNFNQMNPLQIASSSPPTPYLTLTRLSNMANQQQQSNNNRPINLQPINTIPLGGGMMSNSNINGQFGSRTPIGSMIPQRGVMQQQQRGPQQQQQQSNSQQMRPMVSIPLPPSAHIQPPTTNQVKPISGGFAPSGPPPSQQTAASNNAMVVVQSPPNAIGTTQPASGLDDDRLATTTTSATTTTTTAAAATTTAANRDPTTETAQSQTTRISAVSTEPNQEQSSSWSPVDAKQGNRNSSDDSIRAIGPSSTLAPSPDIVTVPPDYNPDAPANGQPESYDISVSTKMGGGGGSVVKPIIVEQPSVSSSATNEATPTIDVAITSSSLIPTIAPTAVTTIIWSPPPSDIPSSSDIIQPTRMTDLLSKHQPITQTAMATAQFTTPIAPTQNNGSTPPSRIRDNSSLNDDPFANGQANDDQAVVYGKPQARDSKPTPPPSNEPQPGRPFIKPAPLDNQVRPYTSSQQQSPLMKSNHHHHHSSSPSNPFKSSRPINSSGGQSVGSGFTITGNQTMPTGDIRDYVAGQPPPLLLGGSSAGSHISGSFQVTGDSHEPTISAQGGPDPASFDLNAQDSSSVASRSSFNSSTDPHPATPSPAPAPKIKRPTFKPKPVEPLIRIDSCIVGDESSCDQSHNERCITEYGISSCHCKPGYARLAQVRGYCSPVSALQMTLKIDKLSDDRRLAYNHTLENPNTEEYQYMEFETIQSLLGLFQQTGMFEQYLGSRVNKFFEHKGKVWANVTLNLVANNVTKTNKISQSVIHEIAKVLRPQKSFGDSTIMFDGSKESVSRLVDINECANPELNDCSKQATCTNEFGGFSCQCLPGYEDKHSSKDKSKHGRICLGCTAAYCSNRGECTIVDGQKQCKCRANFIGTRCDIDSEVMAVAIGGSLVGVIILIVTFWCLFIFNKRWKREQQKMDAMSATSGLTFNYVNSSTNSLMSPTRGIVGGLHRSAGSQHPHQYAQKFGVALSGVGAGRISQHYAPDQQAIMGSTSSGSSAASQPIGCNPYAAGYQYEDSGLLIAPASAGSSEQTSPSCNSYRENALNHLTGTAYTLSGHHHHNHSHHPHHHHHHMLNQQYAKQAQQLTQFHPAGADYRTMQSVNLHQHCPPTATATHPYDQSNRWRTLQQDSSNKALVGYYLSPDMLVNHQQQQQLYASPQRELCIDTDGVGRSRRQQGRSATAQTLRSRSQGSRLNNNSSQQARNSIYAGDAIHYGHERPI